MATEMQAVLVPFSFVLVLEAVVAILAGVLLLPSVGPVHDCQRLGQCQMPCAVSDQGGRLL